MQDTLPFLERLSLGPDADVRAIRRAYAREVSLIDQANEAARFQDLRDAYEKALRWAAYQAHRVDDRDTTAQVEFPSGSRAALPEPGAQHAPEHPRAAAVADAPPAGLPDPRTLAGTAFDQFMATRLALATSTLVDDVAAWKDALRACLDSDDLVNIEARAQFEGMIAQLLAQGWQAGHHTLLAAAASVFDWGGDMRRLHQFGTVGAYVDQAVEESVQFEAQALKDYTEERNVLDRLRLMQVPTDYYLRYYMPHLEKLLAGFPAFMAITVSPLPIAQWQARYRQLPRVPEPEHTTIAAPMWLRVLRERRFSTAGLWVIMVIVSITVLRLVFNGLDPALKRDHRHKVRAEPYVEFPVDQPAEPSPIQQLNKRQLSDIESRIRYRPSTPPAAPLKVAFIVYVSASGELAFLGRYVASGDPAFDDAVAKAIHETKHFEAASLSYKFPFIYSWIPGQPSHQ